jgi:multidrug efflux pump subunit AcrB
VDNAIVVVENIYRYVDQGYAAFSMLRAAAVGEVAQPIITSTATTLAAFLPLILLGRHHRRVHEKSAHHPDHRAHSSSSLWHW